MSPGTALAVVGALLAAAIVTGLLLQRRRAHVRDESSPGALDPADFGLSEFAPRGTFVQFSTAYCQRCPSVRRAIAQLVDGRSGVSFVHVDVTHDLKTATKYKLRQTPSILLIDGAGHPTKRLAGAITREDLTQALTTLVGSDS